MPYHAKGINQQGKTCNLLYTNKGVIFVHLSVSVCARVRMLAS